MRSGVACVNGLSMRTWDAFHQSRGDSLGSRLQLLQGCNLLTKLHLVTGLIAHLEDNQQCLCATQATSMTIPISSSIPCMPLYPFWPNMEWQVRGVIWMRLMSAHGPKKPLKKQLSGLIHRRRHCRNFVFQKLQQAFSRPLFGYEPRRFIRKRQAKVESSAVSASPHLPITDDQYFWRFGHTTMEQARALRITWNHPQLFTGMSPAWKLHAWSWVDCRVQSDMGLLRNLKCALVNWSQTCCTCFQEHPEKKGGAVPIGAYVYQFGLAGKKRNASWEGLRKLILPAFGEWWIHLRPLHGRSAPSTGGGSFDFGSSASVAFWSDDATHPEAACCWAPQND